MIQKILRLIAETCNGNRKRIEFYHPGEGSKLGRFFQRIKMGLVYFIFRRKNPARAQAVFLGIGDYSDEMSIRHSNGNILLTGTEVKWITTKNSIDIC